VLLGSIGKIWMVAVFVQASLAMMETQHGAAFDWQASNRTGIRVPHAIYGKTATHRRLFARRVLRIIKMLKWVLPTERGVSWWGLEARYSLSARTRPISSIRSSVFRILIQSMILRSIFRLRPRRVRSHSHDSVRNAHEPLLSSDTGR
jgi:hypothetical protein